MVSYRNCWGIFWFLREIFDFVYSSRGNSIAFVPYFWKENNLRLHIWIQHKQENKKWDFDSDKGDDFYCFSRTVWQKRTRSTFPKIYNSYHFEFPMLFEIKLSKFEKRTKYNSELILNYPDDYFIGSDVYKISKSQFSSKLGLFFGTKSWFLSFSDRLKSWNKV